MSKSVVTNISGPPGTYKTSMLVLVANAEAQRGRVVTFASADNTEVSLRSKGLDPRVQFQPSDIAEGVIEQVTSTSPPDQLDLDADLMIWNTRQAPRA